jgi:ribonucleoside-diphosphate reductase alpha chain
MDAFATAVSISLQYGVPLEDLCNKFSHMRFEPSGFTNNQQVPMAKSIIDYIFRYLSAKFLHIQSEDTLNPTDAVAAEIDRSGPAEDQTQLTMEFEPTAAVPTMMVTAPTMAHAKAETSTSSFQNQEDAPACSNCGSITVRSGACYSCPNCGSSSGCG